MEPPQVLPTRVIAFMNRHGGYNPRFVMEKTIQKSDVDKQQNRLLIPTNFVELNILPMMREDEKTAANLSTYLLKKCKLLAKELKIEYDGSAHSNTRKKKKDGIDHDGLPVLIYNAAGWRFSSTLVRRDTNSTVLRGKEWLCFAQFNNFVVNDTVEMWAFRRVEDEKFCFLLTKMT